MGKVLAVVVVCSSCGDVLVCSSLRSIRRFVLEADVEIDDTEIFRE